MSEITLSQPGTLADRLAKELKTAVRASEADRPRSKQRSMGASGLGHPCTRNLGYHATGAPPLGAPGDPWPATVGSACHDGPLTKAFEGDPGKWSLGTTMEIGPNLYGTFDLLRHPMDGVGFVVIDHKVLGKASLDSLKRHGAKPQYRVQVHAYGFGCWRQGMDVTHVAIAGWPRSGFLRDVHVWVEPYDVNVVEEAFQRWYGLVDMAPILTAQPQMFNALAMADGPCSWCPWYAPVVAVNHPELGCPGFKGEA
jgi:hypothetical protein